TGGLDGLGDKLRVAGDITDGRIDLSEANPKLTHARRIVEALGSDWQTRDRGCSRSVASRNGPQTKAPGHGPGDSVTTSEVDVFKREERCLALGALLVSSDLQNPGVAGTRVFTGVATGS